MASYLKGFVVYDLLISLGLLGLFIPIYMGTFAHIMSLMQHTQRFNTQLETLYEAIQYGHPPIPFSGHATPIDIGTLYQARLGTHRVKWLAPH